MLIEAEVDGVNQVVFSARLGEKAEDIALVDGGHGGVEIGVTGEQHSHGVGGFLAYFGEEFGAIHAWHAHVRDDDGERAVIPGRGQRLFAAVYSVDFEFVVQHSPEGVQDEGFVVNEENFLSHDAFLSAVFPIGSVCECGGKAQRRIRAG